MIHFNIVLFNNFETLDAFGPADIIGKLPKYYKLEYYSVDGGIVTSSQNIKIDTLPLFQMDMGGIVLIPGGMGTRKLVMDADFIEMIKAISQNAKYVLSVCTGSALLAKTGLLKGKSATTNKMAYDWVRSVTKDVNWLKRARWVVDQNVYTSSGVSAGMDMTLGFISDIHGLDCAQEIANHIEYVWNTDKSNDPFA